MVSYSVVQSFAQQFFNVFSPLAKIYALY